MKRNLLSVLLVALTLSIAGTARADDKVRIMDLTIRNDSLFYRPPSGPRQNRVSPPEVRLSSRLLNVTGGKLKGLVVVTTVRDLYGTVLSRKEEVLPVLRPGRPFLYWAPVTYNPSRALVQADLEIRQGDTVLATRHATEP